MFLQKLHKHSVITDIRNGTLCTARAICLLVANFKDFVGGTFELWPCSVSWFDTDLSVKLVVSAL